MFDQIDPALLPFIDSEARQLLQGGQLSVADHQALLDEAKKKCDFIEASLPKPTREDLVRLVHGENQDQVRVGSLPASVEKNLLEDAKRRWYEGHRADAIRHAKESGWQTLPKPQPPTVTPDPKESPPSSSESDLQKQLEALHSLLPKPKPKPTIGDILSLKPQPRDPEVERHMEGQERANEALLEAAKKEIERDRAREARSNGILIPEIPTEKEAADAELLEFMPDQIRTAYTEAAAEQKAMLWEANKRAFQAASKRKEQRLLREQELTEKVLDTLQKIKEDPTKAHLLPPDNASMQELHKWYEKISQPIRTVPHPNEGGVASVIRSLEAGQSKSPDRERARPGARSDPRAVRASNEPNREPRRSAMEVWAEPFDNLPSAQWTEPETLSKRPSLWSIETIKRHPGRAILTGLPLFLCWIFPLGVAEAWPVLVRDRTLPEWLAANGWPSMTTLAVGWLTLVFLLTVLILTVIMVASARDRRGQDSHQKPIEETRRQRAGLDEEVLTRLAEYMNEGSQLLNEWMTRRTLEPSKTNAERWAERVENYLSDKGMKVYALRFKNAMITDTYPAAGATSRTRGSVNWLYTRINRLEQFIREIGQRN